MHRTQTLLILSLTLAASFTASPAAPLVKFSGESALAYTGKVVAFGPRPVGSDGHVRTQQFITAQLKAVGCRAVEELAWTAQTPVGAKPMKNILARIGAGKPTARPVVITGHYDTKLMPGTTFLGANDGGSSTGLLLELARVLCAVPPANDVWLVWLDGEEATRQMWAGEDNLYGSRWLSKKWAADGTAKRIKALINVDMIGDRDLNILGDLNSSNQLRELFFQSARELDYGRYLTGGQGAIEDDHIPFAQAGIPALDIIDFDYGPGNSYWHTDRDTLDKLGARSFQVVGDSLLRMLNKLGGM